MTGFSSDWLALREPFDRAARAQAAAVLDWPALAARLRAMRPLGAPLAVVDLGCGTGASLRELAPRLGGAQHWRLVDHDARLLAAVPGALADWATAQGLRLEAVGETLVVAGQGLHLTVERQEADLAAGLDAVPLAGAQLVTASALMDLVSAPWLAALVARCALAGAAIGWALNVDDRVDWHPADADDAAVLALFHAHQQRDKGFGPALGGASVACMPGWLAQAGYQVAQARSDWQVDGAGDAQDQAMLQALLDGMAAAAAEQAPDAAPSVQAWLARRQALHARTRLCIGHVDVLAWPQRG